MGVILRTPAWVLNSSAACAVNAGSANAQQRAIVESFIPALSRNRDILTLDARPAVGDPGRVAFAGAVRVSIDAHLDGVRPDLRFDATRQSRAGRAARRISIASPSHVSAARI